MSDVPERLKLIEILAMNTECDVLSDLPLPQNRSRLLQELEKITIEAYSLRDWNDCLSYICKTDLKVGSKNVAYQVIYDYLKSGKQW